MSSTAVALRGVHARWPQQAAQYLDRWGARSPHAVPDGTAGAVTVTDGAAGSADWWLTGPTGAPLPQCPALIAAVGGAADTVIIELRSDAGILARGRVDVRRSVARCVEHALAVAGPLIEMAALGGPLLPEWSAPLPTARSARAADLRATIDFGRRLARAAVTIRQWGVAASPVGLAALAHVEHGGLEGVEWRAPAVDRFWADPHVFTHGDRTWLFVEELQYRVGMGYIRILEVRGDDVVPGDIVLAGQHHLSFPIVQRVGGRFVATVETCAEHNPMYTFEAPGDPWGVAGDLPAMPPHFADAVVRFDDAGRPLEVIGTDVRTDGDSVCNRLSWQDGQWVRDPTATYVDVLTARGGGTSDPRRDLRAVQACAGTYGRSLAVVPDNGWRGPAAPPATLDSSQVAGSWPTLRGVHTLTWDTEAQQVWLDGWRRRFTPLGGYRRVIERRHAKRCTG